MDGAEDAEAGGCCAGLATLGDGEGASCITNEKAFVRSAKAADESVTIAMRIDLMLALGAPNLTQFYASTLARFCASSQDQKVQSPGCTAAVLGVYCRRLLVTVGPAAGIWKRNVVPLAPDSKSTEP